jgi:hypothetical protein
VESLGSGGTDERFKQLVEGTLTEIDDSEVTKVRGYLFYGTTSLLKFHGANVDEIGEYAFSTNSGVPKINDISFPKCTIIQRGAFARCRSLKKALFPSLKILVADAFDGCYEMEMVDLGKAQKLQSSVLRANYSLKAVILRNTEQMTTLAVTNAFTNCYHFYGTVNETYNPEGKKDGYYYVPRKWLSDEDETMDYRRATNWTALGEDRFRALEDYTVDGTTTGELDWEKVNAA